MGYRLTQLFQWITYFIFRIVLVWWLTSIEALHVIKLIFVLEQLNTCFLTSQEVKVSSHVHWTAVTPNPINHISQTYSRILEGLKRANPTPFCPTHLLLSEAAALTIPPMNGVFYFNAPMDKLRGGFMTYWELTWGGLHNRWSVPPQEDCFSVFKLKTLLVSWKSIEGTYLLQSSRGNGQTK